MFYLLCVYFALVQAITSIKKPDKPLSGYLMVSIFLKQAAI